MTQKTINHSKYTLIKRKSELKVLPAFLPVSVTIHFLLLLCHFLRHHIREIFPTSSPRNTGRAPRMGIIFSSQLLFRQPLKFGSVNRNINTISFSLVTKDMPRWSAFQPNQVIKTWHGPLFHVRPRAPVLGRLLQRLHRIPARCPSIHGRRSVSPAPPDTVNEGLNQRPPMSTDRSVFEVPRSPESPNHQQR